jgi:hypothetical protein
VGEKRALLILDGLEPLQYAPTSPTPGELKDQGVAALLKGLAANNKGFCVVTTRYSIPDLRAHWQTTAPEVNLLRLSMKYGVELLQRRNVKGTQAEYEKLVEDVNGHALTLICSALICATPTPETSASAICESGGSRRRGTGRPRFPRHGRLRAMVRKRGEAWKARSCLVAIDGAV